MVLKFFAILFNLFLKLCFCSSQGSKADFRPLPFEKHEYNTDSNITNIIESNNVGLNVTVKPGITCEEARIKCALRQGCGTALQSYMLDCADLMQGRTFHCDEFCKASLIALTSTEEGESLMNCICADEYCKKSKGRLEVCKREVIMANARNAVVSCNVAHLICSADTSCSTALYYYDRFCRRMFTGRGCSYRCNNSISILERQKKAEKLSTCICDGTESFACERIKSNMANLCFNQKEKDIQEQEERTNQIHTSEGDLRDKNGTRTSSSAPSIGYKVTSIWSASVTDIWLGWWLPLVLYPSCLVGLTSAAVVRW